MPTPPAPAGAPTAAAPPAAATASSPMASLIGRPDGAARTASRAAYVVDAAAPQRLERALDDLRVGLRRWRLPAALARLDIRNRYRGSVLGPLWLSLSTAIMIVALGILYSTLFRLDLRDYLPFLAVSLILWNMIAQVVGDACTSLTGAEGIIRQMPLPFSIHALRSVFRNILVAAHSLPLILLVLLGAGQIPGPEALLALPGLALLTINAFAVSLLLGMLCARFRDIAPIVQNVLQLAFFVSPVIWKPELLGDRQPWLLLNPFYTVMETMRGPLVSGGASWAIWASAIAFTLLTCVVAALFFVRFRNRIAFWV